MTQLRWSIYDRENAHQETLWDARGGTVTAGLNADRSASVTIPLDSDAAAHALAVERELHAELNGVPIFHGPIIQPRAAGENGNDTISISAAGPSAQLARQFKFVFEGEGGEALVLIGLSGLFADNWIMHLLLAHADGRYASGGVPGHRIDYGVTADHTGGPNRTISLLDGANIWDSILALANTDGGSDFDFEPLLSGDHSHILRTYPSGMGTDRSDTVRFDYGWGKKNALGFAHAPAGDLLVTRAFAIGPDPEAEARHPLVADVVHTDDLERFGAWTTTISRQNLTTHAALGPVAKGEVAAKHEPVSLLEFTTAPPQDQLATFNANREGKPQVGAGFLCGPEEAGGDFWLGDTISFVAKKNRYSLDFEGRVTAVTIAQDDMGLVTAGVTCAPEPAATGLTQTNRVL